MKLLYIANRPLVLGMEELHADRISGDSFKFTFVNGNCLILIIIFIEVYFLRREWVSVCLDYGLVTVLQQAII